MKCKIIFFLIVVLCLFSINLVFSVDLEKDVQLKPTDVNTTFIMGENFSFNSVEVYSHYIRLNNNSLFVNSTSGWVNVTLLNFTTSYKKWNETYSDSSAIISHQISNFTADTSILIKKKSISWVAVSSNSTGYVNFNYNNEAVSSAIFEFEAGTMPSEESTTTSSDVGAVFRPSKKQLEKGYEKSLLENWKINFQFLNKTYSINIDILTSNLTQVSISGGEKEINFNLSVGEIKNLDLDNDEYYDLEIFLEKISNSRAKLLTKLIHTSVFEDKEKNENEMTIKKQEGSLWTEKGIGWKIIFFILILVIIAIIIYKLYVHFKIKRDLKGYRK